MRMLKTTFCILVLGMSRLAQADFIGVTGDINYWSVDGNLKDHRSSTLSYDAGSSALIIDPDIGSSGTYDIDRDGAFQASLAFEHPIPLIPNVKLRYTSLDLDAKAYALSMDQSSIDLDQTDFILYYEILDNIISADVGLGVLKLKGQVKQYDDMLAITHKIDGHNPLVYAQLGAKLPFTGFQAKAEMLYSDYDDVKITDFQAELQYNMIQNLLIDVGAKIGYRVLNIYLDYGDDAQLKMEFKGPYLGLAAYF